MATTVSRDEAITRINEIFGTSEKTRNANYVNYMIMKTIATRQGTKVVDLSSLNNKKHQDELVKIVNKIFTKVSQPDAGNVSSLNKFLLKLPEAGLSKEALEDIYNKYNEIFGKHITFETVNANNVVDLEKAIGYKVSNADARAISTHKHCQARKEF